MIITLPSGCKVFKPDPPAPTRYTGAIERNHIYHSDALAFARALDTNSINCVVTSPPYYRLRSYLPDDDPNKSSEIGLEETPEQYVLRMVELFREIRRALRDDGTLWLNLGDSYVGSTSQHHGSASQGHNSVVAKGTYAAVPSNGRKTRVSGAIKMGLKPKDLIGIPWRVAFALQADGWYLRSDIIWHKPNPMPESVTDRPTKAHEYVFLLSKSERYFYDADAIRDKSDCSSGWDKQRKKGVNTWQYNNTAERILSTGQHIESSTLGDGSTRNKRTVWTIATEPSQLPHYAMFPQALIEPMILAGCPSQVCAACGKPYVRDVEREASEYNAKEGASQAKRCDGVITGGTEKVTLGKTHLVKRETRGISPTCSCHAKTRPGIVYDPFMGTGTTALVAQRLGRDFIGGEINEESVKIARDRLHYGGDDKRMLEEKAAGVKQVGMFDEPAA